MNQIQFNVVVIHATLNLKSMILRAREAHNLIHKNENVERKEAGNILPVCSRSRK